MHEYTSRKNIPRRRRQKFSSIIHDSDALVTRNFCAALFFEEKNRKKIHFQEYLYKKNRAAGRKSGKTLLPPARICGIIIKLPQRSVLCRPADAKKAYTFMQRYRSGHNELDSKSSCPQGHVGSNPTRCATSEQALYRLLRLFSKGRARSRRCASFPHRNRFAGLRCGFAAARRHFWELRKYQF